MRFLLIALAVAAGPVLAQPAPERSAPERGAAFAGVSYLRTAGVLGRDNGLDTEVLTLRLGGEAHLFSRPGPTGPTAGTLGVALQAVDFSADGFFRSGLRPQSVEVYGRVARASGPVTRAATAGFVLDLGPDFGSGPGDDAFPNSDRRDAVRLGVDASTEHGRDRASGGIEAIYLLPLSDLIAVSESPPTPTTETVEYTVRGGHVITVAGGASRVFRRSVEVGLRVVGVYRTEENARSEGGCDPGGAFGLCGATPRRYVVSLVPHVRFARPESPLSVTLAGEAPAGFFGEHTRLGVGGVGEGEPRAWLPLTLAVRVSL